MLFFLDIFLPITELLLCFVLGNAIGFLNLAGQLIALAGNHIVLIIGKLAPLLFDIAFELFQFPSIRSQFILCPLHSWKIGMAQAPLARYLMQ